MFLRSFWVNILVLVFGNTNSWAYFRVANGGSSFSSVIKQYSYQRGSEVLLYKGAFDQPGHITEQWFTGYPFDNNARLLVYIDGEDTPSLDYYLFLTEDENLTAGRKLQSPWSAKWFGQLANDGGFFMTFRIPFMSEVRITMRNEKTSGSIWYIVRGLVGIPLIVGNFELPDNCRLRVYTQDQDVAPYDFLTISNSTNSAGLLFLVTLNAQSKTPLFMESCMRAEVDGRGITFLSSGMEDFFLSAFYFNRGPYHGLQSGLIYDLDSGNCTQVIAYKFFVDDPVIFRKSLKLIWRNSETFDGPDGCPSQFPPSPGGNSAKQLDLSGDVAEARMLSNVWVYEWPQREENP